jgi:hypothetical protein
MLPMTQLVLLLLLRDDNTYDDDDDDDNNDDDGKYIHTMVGDVPGLERSLAQAGHMQLFHGLGEEVQYSAHCTVHPSIHTYIHAISTFDDAQQGKSHVTTTTRSAMAPTRPVASWPDLDLVGLGLGLREVSRWC